ANRLSAIDGLVPAYSINGSADPKDWGAVPASDNAEWNAAAIVEGSTGWRLPTEAQWEFAARAGTSTAFSNGEVSWENKGELDGIGWFDFNSGSMTHAVGRKAANPWGLHDIHGNVWEWVWDWFGTYPAQAQTDPKGAPSGSARVLRGGCWIVSARNARSADRVFDSPFFRVYVVGLRLLRP
ncbi:MAG: formylglycine-generating enzyme family protein, partial [Spirochaetes bacterium]|nr:formylglycine-generating enzyme family protein [Spirochaetota bacterium]